MPIEQFTGDIAGTRYSLQVGPDWISLVLAIPIIPYVRQTQRGKYVSARARAYNEQQKAISDRVLLLMREHNLQPFPDDAELICEVQVTRTARRGDASNIYKAVEDALQGTFYKNDSCITSLSCNVGESKRALFSVYLEVLT